MGGAMETRTRKHTELEHHRLHLVAERRREHGSGGKGRQQSESVLE